MRKKLLFFVLGLLFLPMAALAIEARQGNFINLASDQVINGNYYAAGNKIEVYGTVNGDVFVAGSDITIDSTNINGDIFAAGNTITIKGKVNGSLRLAGQKLEVDGDVARNILAAGQYLNIDKDARVTGNVAFAGQMASVDGSVTGRWESVVENFRLSGQLASDAEIYLNNTREASIDLTDSAVINGGLKYWSAKALTINSKAKVDKGVNFQQIAEVVKNKFRPQLEFLGLWWQLLSMLLVALVLWRLSPKFFQDSYEVVKKYPGKSLLWGLAALVLTPLIFILLLITVIGMPLAFITIGLWFVGLYLAQIVAAWLLIKWAQETWWSKYAGKDWALLIAGVILFVLFTKIPVIGWLLNFVLYLWAWGSIGYRLYNYKSNKS